MRDEYEGAGRFMGEAVCRLGGLPSSVLDPTLKASRISSSESVSFILRAIMVRNSGKSMVPLPSASTWHGDGKLLHANLMHNERRARGTRKPKKGTRASPPPWVPYLVDHVLQLSLGGVLAQRPHDGAQLLGRDGAIAVLVEQGERLLELRDLEMP